MFLDETGITTNLLRRYGRAPRGARVHDHAPCGRWQTSTLLAALRVTGLTAPGVFDGAIDGERFRAYIEQILVPTLQPGDIVIADNLGPPKVAGIQRAIQAAGATLWYLPPYSQDLNPIELCFAKLKALVRTARCRSTETRWPFLGECLAHFSPDECRNYFRHCGYSAGSMRPSASSREMSGNWSKMTTTTGGLQRGDRVVVSELSRLGRSLGQIVAILDALATADVAFVALKEHIRVEGTRDIQTKVLTTLFALFAEVERDLISERTREGLARARASGKKLGRPKGALGVSRLDGKEDDIRRFLELGVSKTAIAKITGVSRTSLYSFMSTRGLKPSPSRVFLHESGRYPRWAATPSSA